MKIQPNSAKSSWRKAVVFGTGLLVLTGCEDGQTFSLFKPKPGATETDQAAGSTGRAVKLVERDVEAPDVFQVTDKGLWDGRPSLGGVWVAHADVAEPERVIIRNTDNSKFVIGALFRRERENPGPSLQVSSDAAVALGMLAGAPVELNVTALRREEAPETIEAPIDPAVEDLAAPAVKSTALDPVAGAAAALDAVEDEPVIKPAEAAAPAPSVVAKPQPNPKSKPKPAAKPSGLEKPYIQIGIFSVEQNANNTAAAMRQAGMLPTVKKQSSQGKTFWRVIVGPASSQSERSVLLKKIKGVGFDDAYAVTN